MAVHDGYEVEIDLRRGHLCPQAMLRNGPLPLHRGLRAAGRAMAVARAVRCRGDRRGGDDLPAQRPLFRRRGHATAGNRPAPFADAAAAAAALRRGEIECWIAWPPGRSSRGGGGGLGRATLRPAAGPLPDSQPAAAPDCQPDLPPRLGLRDRPPGHFGGASLRRPAAGLCGAPRSVSARRFGRRTPSGYASDPEFKPWPYDPRLAVALAEAGRREAAGSPPGASPPSHAWCWVSPRAKSRTACAAIRRQLAAIDVAVELKELDPAGAVAAAAEVDLLYVELALWEPVVDAPRVLGEEGLCRGAARR